jgi:hypothetical protein
VQVPDKAGKFSISLSFDDTPGLDDTKYADRAVNEDLFRSYSKVFYSRIDRSVPHTSSEERSNESVTNALLQRIRERMYPNVIVLVASWDSVTVDDNDPETFTSSIGKTIHSLINSNLVDEQRPNVIVVVTKSLTFWDDYDDYDSYADKAAQWNQDAKEKTNIINGLRSKVFPQTEPWPVVFVENGGGLSTAWRALPNGEMSHQNLFDAILKLAERRTHDDAQDLVCMHALRFMTGALLLNQGDAREGIESVYSRIAVYPLFPLTMRYL